MKNLILLIFGLILLNNCTKSQEDYPNEIISFSLEKEFDSSKWLLYKLNINETTIGYLPGEEYMIDSTSEKVLLTESNLDFFDIKIVKDTIDLSFFFYHKGKPVSIASPNHHFHTVRFIEKNIHSIIGGDVFEISASYLVNTKGELKFREYLKENKKQLNSWLLMEAKKRKIF